ncbi:acyl carrier protein [Streptomyces pluripotens]|uniref:Acyl carrier protein n=1 Tax=Streptomyces pluripotens TaxID=1355015 RepID=A0A221NTR3_9ACTN|nr:MULTISPECIES: acyl carrier protein [Streptomyces]ARP69091.1 acyl carrier protein [Streptomyces pluripotens]ASN23351.1 acyl carrier protein [Streptomyces pluripotens]KIE25625.1 acyl carrier protein [Streptomyces sp. MUSC 125]MCH0559005.1 acyl carrier protein [Streptomyces sp. MUM 16J]
MNPTQPAPAQPTAHTVLAEVTGMLRTVLAEYGDDDVVIGMSTSFNRDLELESIDLVTLAGLLEERYGKQVNLAEFLAGMEFDEIIELTVARLVEYVVWSLKTAQAG